MICLIKYIVLETLEHSLFTQFSLTIRQDVGCAYSVTTVGMESEIMSSSNPAKVIVFAFAQILKKEISSPFLTAKG